MDIKWYSQQDQVLQPHPGDQWDLVDPKRKNGECYTVWLFKHYPNILGLKRP